MLLLCRSALERRMGERGSESESEAWVRGEAGALPFGMAGRAGADGQPPRGVRGLCRSATTRGDLNRQGPIQFV